MESEIQRIEARLAKVEARLADLERECAKISARVDFVEKEPVKPSSFQLDSHLVLMA